MTTPDISKLAVRNTLWAYLTYTMAKALAFVTTIILARLLLPAQFGVVGYCLIAFQYLDLLNDFGVGSAVIARRDKIAEAQNAAFVVGLSMSVLLFIVAWFGAPGLADFFREPQVTNLFRALSAAILINTFGLVPNAILLRDLRFKQRMIPETASVIFKGTSSIILALSGAGVWSLVIGQLIGQLAHTSISVAMVRWRPTREFDPQVTREVLRYGVNITAVGLLGSFMANVDYLLVGRLLGAAALGYYTMAFRIPELVIRSVSQIVSRVAFPVLARLQSDKDKVHGMYFAYLRYMSLFTFPVGVGLAFVAGSFIRIFLSSVWVETIVPMQFISLASGFSVVSYLSGVIYNAIGRPEITRKLSLAKLPLVIAVLYAGTRWGIAGVAAGHVVLTILAMALDVVVIQRVLDIRATDVLGALRPALLGVATMSIVLVAVGLLVRTSNAASLIVMPVVGAATYAGTIWLVSRETLLQARTVLRGSLARG